MAELKIYARDFKDEDSFRELLQELGYPIAYDNDNNKVWNDDSIDEPTCLVINAFKDDCEITDD